MTSASVDGVKHEPHLESILDDRDTLAIILRSSFRAAGIEFFTPEDYSMQLGYMNRPAGYVIKPHLHLPVARVAQYTQEVLFIRSGLVRVNFYSEQKVKIGSRVLGQGDVILLIKGGHGFEIIEAAEIVEVKQGPYHADADKERFEDQSS